MSALEHNIARVTPPRALQVEAPTVLSRERLDAPLDGHQLQGSTLAEVVGGGTTLLVFLRHFG
ncbi:MAG: hypothetical protein OES24_05810 [Acidimicrobiia bacterium]|nr:hypothetical protein [Acidimicrobiia bacterium]